MRVGGHMGPPSSLQFNQGLDFDSLSRMPGRQLRLTPPSSRREREPSHGKQHQAARLGNGRQQDVVDVPAGPVVERLAEKHLDINRGAISGKARRRGILWVHHIIDKESRLRLIDFDLEIMYGLYSTGNVASSGARFVTTRRIVC